MAGPSPSTIANAILNLLAIGVKATLGELSISTLHKFKTHLVHVQEETISIPQGMLLVKYKKRLLETQTYILSSVNFSPVSIPKIVSLSTK